MADRKDGCTKKRLLQIDGAVETDSDFDTWHDAFIEWLESRGECFGGGLQRTGREWRADSWLTRVSGNG